MINIVVVGANGRMGRALMQACHYDPHLRLSAAVVREGSSLVGVDAGELAGLGKLDVGVTDRIPRDDCDLVVDFTHPEISMSYVDWCCRNDKKIVIGTTGFTDQQKSKLQETSEQIPVVLAPNMSVGVNLCFYLAEIAAGIMGETSDIEIIEAHHRHKVDAPSGTALALGEKIAAVLNRKLKDVALFGREGQIGVRDGQTIGFSTVRAGDIIGEHTVMMASEGERVEITHRASSRSNFAGGAMRAALWLQAQGPGLYDMQDVLGLKP